MSMCLTSKMGCMSNRGVFPIRGDWIFASQILLRVRMKNALRQPKYECLLADFSLKALAKQFCQAASWHAKKFEERVVFRSQK